MSAPGESTRWTYVWLLLACGIGATMQVGKVPPALDLIQHDLHLGLVLGAWVISMFSVVGATAGVSPARWWTASARTGPQPAACSVLPPPALAARWRRCLGCCWSVVPWKVWPSSWWSWPSPACLLRAPAMAIGASCRPVGDLHAHRDGDLPGERATGPACLWLAGAVADRGCGAAGAGGGPVAGTGACGRATRAGITGYG